MKLNIHNGANLANIETLEDKLWQIESRHKLEVNLLKERVSQLGVRKLQLKGTSHQIYNFQKECNKRMGRIDNDLSRIKQKESEKKSSDSVSSLENSDEHSSNSDHALSLSMAMLGRKLIRMGVCLHMLQQLFQQHNKQFQLEDLT